MSHICSMKTETGLDVLGDLELPGPNLKQENRIDEVAAVLDSLLVPDERPLTQPVQLKLPLPVVANDPIVRNPPRKLTPCDDFDLDEILGHASPR